MLSEFTWDTCQAPLQEPFLYKDWGILALRRPSNTLCLHRATFVLFGIGLCLSGSPFHTDVDSAL